MLRSDRIRITGPLAPYLGAVEKSLLARGYTEFSTKNRLGWTAQLSRWMLHRRIAADALTESHLQAFVRFKRRVVPAFSRGRMDSVVKNLAEIGAITAPEPLPQPPPSRVDQTLAPFDTYLRQERALKYPDSYTKVIGRFLIERFGARILQRCITADDLTAFVLRESRRYGTSHAKNSVTALRSYVRFLHVSGVIPRDLTGAIPAIAGWRLSGIPKGVDPRQIARLLRAPDRRTRTGRRDYAILLLLARLGLRRHEVASLELEQIDWQRSELLIRGKGEKQERLPLPKEVGAALADHLRKGMRIEHSRAVFLGVRTPFQPLMPTAISNVVSTCALKAGLPPIRPHRIRHTVATQILRCGGSLDEVAQVLRHSSHDTTAIYAKVDLNALRAVAQPWPGSAS